MVKNRKFWVEYAPWKSDTKKSKKRLKTTKKLPKILFFSECFKKLFPSSLKITKACFWPLKGRFADQTGRKIDSVQAFWFQHLFRTKVFKSVQIFALVEFAHFCYVLFPFSCAAWRRVNFLKISRFGSFLTFAIRKSGANLVFLAKNLSNFLRSRATRSPRRSKKGHFFENTKNFLKFSLFLIFQKVEKR